MSLSHHLIVNASLKSTLELVENIEHRWDTADLTHIEKGVLRRWVTSARACVTEYVLLLDVTEDQPLKSVLRNYRFNLLANSDDGKDPEKKRERVLPRTAYERITSYLEAVLGESGSGGEKKYQHPSNLPFFNASYYRVLGPEHRKSYRSPSLAFLAIDCHLDLIGGQLFRMQKKEVLEFVPTVAKSPYIQANALAYWSTHGGWQRVRYKLSSSLTPAWSSEIEDYNEQLAIFQDLERVFRAIQDGIVKTPNQLVVYIETSLKLAPRTLAVDQLMLRPEEPDKHGLHFFSSTRSRLIASRFFSTQVAHHGASSTGTSQSLGRFSSKFFPQARSLSGRRV